MGLSRGEGGCWGIGCVRYVLRCGVEVTRREDVKMWPLRCPVAVVVLHGLVVHLLVSADDDPGESFITSDTGLIVRACLTLYWVGFLIMYLTVRG